MFRGKRIDNGRWVHGDLIHEPYGTVIQYYNEEIKDKGNCAKSGSKRRIKATIDPETVCQHTEKFDDNENKIWEEDFIKINGEWIGRVIWRDDVTAFCVLPNDDIERETYCLGFYIEEGYRVEVIGNIFDNPELLNH